MASEISPMASEATPDMTLQSAKTEDERENAGKIVSEEAPENVGKGETEEAPENIGQRESENAPENTSKIESEEVPEESVESIGLLEIGIENVGKREREEAPENGIENDVVSKKQKVEDKLVEEVKMEDVVEEDKKENVGPKPVGLGPITFGTSLEMFDYFYNLLHHWPLNFTVNKYEYMVLLDLIKKGHPEPDKKIGSGITAFEIHYHPMWKSRCFFVIRDDKSVEDFSFRKCVDQILPLPENMKIKSDVNKVLGGNGSGKKGGRGGGGGGRGSSGGGRGRERGGRSGR